MNYLTLDLANGNLVLSDNSVWKSLRVWLGGGTLYSDYYDASNCGDYWGASRHWINIDSSNNSTYLTFAIEYEFVNATATNSCLCQIRFDNTEAGIAVTADTTGLSVISVATANHIDCNYANANIKIDIIVNLSTKEITTYIHKNDVPLAKIVNNSTYAFTKFVIQAGARGSYTYKLPTTTKLLNVSVSDDSINYSDFTDTINYVDRLGLFEIWANIKNYITAQLLGKSDTGHTHVKSEITDFPSYGTTAGTICEGNDSRLSDARTPTSHTHTKSQITDFPSLSTVATSGSYNDLGNKPTIRNDILHYDAVSSLDVNALSQDGIWHVYGGITGAPMSNHGVLYYVKSVGTPNQLYFPDNLLDVYKRIYTNSAWGPWQNMTSEIDSIGSNWVRFKSGIQICWGEGGHNISEDTYTFPKTFTNSSYVVFVTGTKYDSSGNSYMSSYGNPFIITSRTTTAFTVNGGSGGYCILYLAVGKWK